MTSKEPGELELPGLLRDRVKEGARKAAETKARKAAAAVITEVDPVAEVLLDLPGAHLDRIFDYAVPEALNDAAQPGVRVKARFGARDVDGLILARSATSAHSDGGGRLAPLRRVVGTESVLTPAVAKLLSAVAEEYAGTRADVARLAIPPRHGATEAEPSVPAPAMLPFDPESAGRAWAGHEPADAFLSRVAAGSDPGAVWHVAPGADWPTLLSHAVSAARASGRGAVVVVPDHRDVARLSAALDVVLGPGQHAVLTADQGPAARYRSFLAIRRGAVQVAIGTRAAIWAPVQDLGLVAVWDDGSPFLAEPRSPYPHARAVALLRAGIESAAYLVGGFAPSAEALTMVDSGRAHLIAPRRDFSRTRLRVSIPGASEFALDRDPLAHATRVPREAYALIRAAVESGPVLLQVPRKGYAAALACDTCRTPARCQACSGPLHQPQATVPPSCRWCGVIALGWQCSACAGQGLRAPVVGEARTAEEVGRAFPGVRVVSSTGERPLRGINDAATIVVATPGAEPTASEGYAAVIVLDTWLALGWPGLRSDDEALRRFSAALALARPGGEAMLVGDPAHPVLQALVRWDQPGFVLRGAADRAAAHFPPATRIATISGEAGAVDDALTLLALPSSADVLGPVESGDTWRAVVRIPAAQGSALAAALGEMSRVRAARRLDPVRIHVDPSDL